MEETHKFSLPFRRHFKLFDVRDGITKVTTPCYCLRSLETSFNWLRVPKISCFFPPRGRQMRELRSNENEKNIVKSLSDGTFDQAF